MKLGDIPVVSPAADQSVLLLHEALEAFAKVAPRQAKVVELRYFGGMNMDDIGAVMTSSARTIERDWEFSRARLKRELGQ